LDFEYLILHLLTILGMLAAFWLSHKITKGEPLVEQKGEIVEQEPEEPYRYLDEDAGQI